MAPWNKEGLWGDGKWSIYIQGLVMRGFSWEMTARRRIRERQRERGKTQRLSDLVWLLKHWSQTSFLAVKKAPDYDSLWLSGTQIPILDPPSVWRLQVLVLYERPYTAPQQGLQHLSEPRRIWTLGVFSHIMRCGLLAGHSQQGMADLNINTASS